MPLFPTRPASTASFCEPPTDKLQCGPTTVLLSSSCGRSLLWLTFALPPPSHYHPVALSAMSTDHLEATAAANTEHSRRMEALGNEHEIRMAHITSQATDLPAGKEQYHLREWNLSAIDRVQSNQHMESLERASEAAARRKKEAHGEAQRELADASLQGHTASLANLRGIERSHRLKMMALEEEA